MQDRKIKTPKKMITSCLEIHLKMKDSETQNEFMRDETKLDSVFATGCLGKKCRGGGRAAAIVAGVLVAAVAALVAAVGPVLC